MRTGKIICFVLIAAALFSYGCAAYTRFTHDEIKDYPLDVQEKITKGEVMPGMTPQQVRYAWGPPDSVVSHEPVSGKQKEEWIYSSFIGIFKTRLTFIDGKLVYVVSSEPGRIK